MGPPVFFSPRFSGQGSLPPWAIFTMNDRHRGIDEQVLPAASSGAAEANPMRRARVTAMTVNFILDDGEWYRRWGG
jgi:hypothetical protein